MKIENLVREKIIGNIKIGTKSEKGYPKKLPYFNVEEDKVTSIEMVNIFRQLYKNKPTKLIIMFTSESPFDLKYKRYVNNKLVCMGNDIKAVTIGKDGKGNTNQVEIECNEQCEQRCSKKCKLIGSLKFVLVGIEAGGVWKINTGGGYSLTNIATEIFKYKKAGRSIVGVPFELTLTEQDSLGYGVYYSLGLKGIDMKPQLTGEIPQNEEKLITNKQEDKQLTEEKKETKRETKKEKIEEKAKESEVIDEPKTEDKKEEQPKEDFSNYLTVKKFMPTIINNAKFDKIIFEDINSQDVEYVLHPKANQELIKCMPGTIIEMTKSKVEADRNILCRYEIKQRIDADGSITQTNNNEMKEAV